MRGIRSLLLYALVWLHLPVACAIFKDNYREWTVLQSTHVAAQHGAHTYKNLPEAMKAIHCAFAGMTRSATTADEIMKASIRFVHQDTQIGPPGRHCMYLPDRSKILIRAFTDDGLGSKSCLVHEYTHRALHIVTGNPYAGMGPKGEHMQEFKDLETMATLAARACYRGP